MLSLTAEDSLPADWQYKESLDSDHVFDAVITSSLLKDHHFHKSTLLLPHKGDQSAQFEEFPRLERYELSCLQWQTTDYIYLERYELGMKYEYTLC